MTTKLHCEIAIDEPEKEACFEIRRKVFVEEQQMFNGSDRDEHDPHAIHFALKLDKKIIGTVRIYPAEDGVWFGGRLAVLKEYRSNEAGSALVKAAVDMVRERNARRFLAYIQLSRVHFFERLGWRETGKEIEHAGRSHKIMEMPLDEELLQTDAATMSCENR